MNPWDRLRKRVLNNILNFLKENESRLSDDFPTQLTNLYLDLVQESRRLPESKELLRRAARIKTKFFRENRRLSKATVLDSVVERLTASLRNSRELKGVIALIDRVFVTHSNTFPDVYRHFSDVILSASYQPVIAEETPNYGRSWNPGQKAEALMKTCGALVAVITPDDPQTKLPRPNVGHEVGVAGVLQIPIIYLKAKEAKLLSNIAPVYISFPMAHPEEADSELISNLRSLKSRPPD